MKAIIVLTVFLDGSAETHSLIAAQAKAAAARMFQAAGVELRWCRPPACPADAIRLAFTRLPEGKGAGRAYIFNGNLVEIDYARVTSRRPVREAQALLAHVIVHELTHLLQGCDHHSSQGIMKAHWSRNDIARMADQPAGFTELDVELIHAGAARHSGELLSMAKPR